MSESEPVRDEDFALSRRGFVKAVGAWAVVGQVGQGRAEAEGKGAGEETAVARFYRSLDEGQKAQICFPSEHPLRYQVANNWAVVRPAIGDLRPEQRALCGEVLKALCSEDGHERFVRQMGEDGGGFERYHVAFFGEPGQNETPFEWLLTGRHVTLRSCRPREGSRAAP